MNKPDSRLKRGLKGSYYFLNILLPLSETRRIAIISSRPWRTLMNRIQGLYPKKSENKQVTLSLSWQDAVRDSGFTPTQLEQQYRISVGLCFYPPDGAVSALDGGAVIQCSHATYDDMDKSRLFCPDWYGCLSIGIYAGPHL